MTRVSRRLTTGTLAAFVVLGLLPGAALAATPVAVATTATTLEDTAVTITLIATDDDGDGLTFTTATGPTHGDLAAFSTPDCDRADPLECSSTVEYTPDSNYHGADSFTFTADDGTGGTNTASVAITVADVNDAPSGTDKTITIAEDASHVFPVSDFGFTDVNDVTARHAVSAPDRVVAGGRRPDHEREPRRRLASTVVVPAARQRDFLRFTPAANTSGLGYASFTFQVQRQRRRTPTAASTWIRRRTPSRST